MSKLAGTRNSRICPGNTLAVTSPAKAQRLNVRTWTSAVARSLPVLLGFAFLFWGDLANAQIDLGFTTDALIGSNFINFGNYPTDSAFAPAPGYGTFIVGSVQPGGLFLSAGVTVGETGQIQSLSMALEPVRQPQFDTLYLNAPFMTFNAGGSDLQLFLTAALQGTLAPDSPLAVYSLPSGILLSFALDGIVLNTTTNARQIFTMTCAETLNGVSAAEFLSILPLQTPLSCTIITIQIQTEVLTIINSVNTLQSEGVLNRGRDNSLVKKLQHAINRMDAGKNAGAIDSLSSFIDEVNDLLSSGVLSASQANPLISAAQAVIAQLS